MVPSIHFSFELITRFNDMTKFRVRKGNEVHELKIFRVCFFISSVASLPVCLESTPTESLQEHKKFSTSSEPGQYPDGVSCITSLCRKPFSSFAFIYIFDRTVH